MGEYPTGKCDSEQASYLFQIFLAMVQRQDRNVVRMVFDNTYSFNFDIFGTEENWHGDMNAHNTCL